MKLLFLMTTGMSLRIWNELGQLSRELNIYSQLNKKIEKIYIYTYGYRDNLFIKNNSSLHIISKKCKIWLWLPPKLTRYLNYFWNIFNLIRYRKIFHSIDIIKTNQFIGAIWGLILKIVFNKILVIRMGYYYTNIKKMPKIRLLLEQFVFTKADKIFVTNRNAQDFIYKTYNLPHDKVIFLPNSIDTAIFSPMKMKKVYDVIFVGRLHCRKNLEELLVALAYCNNFTPKVIFIGTGKDKEELQDISNKYQINLVIIKQVENNKLPEFYNMSKLFILPSFFEGSPKALLEAMSCALPVIGTNVPGIKEIISHGENGHLCEPNSSSLHEAINIIYNNNKYQKKLGSNARKYILNNFSLNSLIDIEIEIYKSLIYK